MQVRIGKSIGDINAALDIDARAMGSHQRADYIRSIAERGGLRVALHEGCISGFCCIDFGYFFEKPFVSLLMIKETDRRSGFGRALLRSATKDHCELWTSTNRSNTPMRHLLQAEGWTYCGEVEGLDDGDPELFFKMAR